MKKRKQIEILRAQLNARRESYRALHAEHIRCKGRRVDAIKENNRLKIQLETLKANYGDLCKVATLQSADLVTTRTRVLGLEAVIREFLNYYDHPFSRSSITDMIHSARSVLMTPELTETASHEPA